MLEGLFCLSGPYMLEELCYLSVSKDAAWKLFCLSVPEDAESCSVFLYLKIKMLKGIFCLFVPEGAARMVLSV